MTASTPPPSTASNWRPARRPGARATSPGCAAPTSCEGRWPPPRTGAPAQTLVRANVGPVVVLVSTRGGREGCETSADALWALQQTWLRVLEQQPSATPRAGWPALAAACRAAAIAGARGVRLSGNGSRRALVVGGWGRRRVLGVESAALRPTSTGDATTLLFGLEGFRVVSVSHEQQQDGGQEVPLGRRGWGRRGAGVSGPRGALIGRPRQQAP